ncbi:MAG: rod shape-determining protein RodA [Peptoniphilaceae bacterium]|nr:rod shape-determining protein RodA [Peptoniphilaceae bacterium]MDY6018405.1 rod shape-determining protein RodA [Anaerococcus sp.]
MFNLKKKNLKQLDILLLLSTILLSVYGLFVLYSAYAGKLGAIKSQIFSTLLGFLFIIIICTLDLDVLKKIYKPVYLVCVILLGLTVIFGRGGQEWGSDSWLVLGPISFQPSEITKVGLIFVLASHMDKYRNRINELPVLLATLIIAGIPVFLIMLQPDFGTAMVYLFFIAIMLFVGGLDWKWIIILMSLAIVALIFLLLNLEGYKANRILDFLDPSRDTSGSGWQQQQGLIAIGSGMLRGRGYMQGTQAQYGYIPEKETDYIFSVLAEELGFIGAIVMLVLFALLIFRLIAIVKSSNNLFISLLVSGICGMFFIHIFENVGMTIGIMPVTGIPLPFFSYGGTFQLISLINIGLCLSASIQKTYYDLDTSQAEILTIQRPKSLVEKNN